MADGKERMMLVEETRSLTSWVVSTLKRCVQGAMSNDAKGSAGLVRGGEDRCQTEETSREGKGKGNGTKGEHGKKGEFGSKGAAQSTKLTNDEDEEEVSQQDVRKMVARTKKGKERKRHGKRR